VGASGGIGEGLELDGKAELGELADQAPDFGFRRVSIEVVGAEIAMRQTRFEHVINRGQDRSGDGADCLLRPASALQPKKELRPVVAVFGAFGGHCFGRFDVILGEFRRTASSATCAVAQGGFYDSLCRLSTPVGLQPRQLHADASAAQSGGAAIAPACATS
jgi:hypothetical protein